MQFADEYIVGVADVDANNGYALNDEVVLVPTVQIRDLLLL